MGKWFRLLAASFLIPAPGWGQTSGPEPSAVDLANLHEDVSGLSQRVADLTLRVEQLEAQNAALQQKLAARRDGPDAADLKDAIAELRQAIQSAVTASQEETLREVDAKLEKLGQQASAPSPAAKPAPAASSGFRDDFPKQGITYVVQRGDTLALIAKKNGAKFQDIVNANRLADPSRILIGQTLFIPQANK